MDQPGQRQLCQRLRPGDIPDPQVDDQRRRDYDGHREGTGNFVAYGPDGKAIARNPGQTRLELLFDVDGTFLGVVRVIKESTGRTEDFCEAAVPVLIG